MLDSRHAPAVAERFALGRAIRLAGPVGFGRLGEIWRIDSDRGAYAVKQFRSPPEPEACERDAGYQALVSAAGIPMPAVVRTCDGRVLGEVEGVVLRAYTWVDVAEPDRNLDPAEVGRLLAAIHLVHVPASDAVDGWYADPLGADAWADLVTRLSDADAPFVERLAGLVPGIVEAETLLVAPTDVQTCHRDLWADNVRQSPGGRLLVLDWENCGAASPAHELGVAAYEFGGGDPDRVRRLYAAYVAAGGPGRLREPGDLTMLVAQLGHIAATGCERWLVSDTDEERADNAAWVGEFLEEPPTAAFVESILAAVR